MGSLLILASKCVLGEKIKNLTILGSLFIMVTIVLMSLDDVLLLKFSLFGMTLGLLGSIALALFLKLNENITYSLPPLIAISIANGVSLLTLTVFSFIFTKDSTVSTDSLTGVFGFIQSDRYFLLLTLMSLVGTFCF